MSELPQQQPLPADGEGRNLPVLARPVEARAIERAPAIPLSAPVLAATGGFLAGFTTYVFARLVRGGGRLPFRQRRRRRRRGSDVLSSHTFLVDVHVLKR